jgi:hypothetical protein
MSIQSDGGILLPAERIAVTVAQAQALRGDPITPNVACVLLMAVERLAKLTGPCTEVE